ncbi:MAG: heavy-metal-associated domain-containing protein [Turicibacter sp.]
MEKKLLIEGMSCQHCVSHVKEALLELSGVSSVEVNLEGKFAVIETSCDNELLRATIDEAGYDLKEIINL